MSKIPEAKRIEILERAVEKARKAGFSDSGLRAFFHREQVAGGGKDFMRRALAASPHSLIFRHDFARALFGSEPVLEEYPLSDGSGEYLKIWMPGWQAHLRKMVLEEDPIYYIAGFV